MRLMAWWEKLLAASVESGMVGILRRCAAQNDSQVRGLGEVDRRIARLFPGHPEAAGRRIPARHRLQMRLRVLPGAGRWWNGRLSPVRLMAWWKKLWAASMDAACSGFFTAARFRTTLW